MGRVQRCDGGDDEFVKNAWHGPRGVFVVVGFDRSVETGGKPTGCLLLSNVAKQEAAEETSSKFQSMFGALFPLPWACRYEWRRWRMLATPLVESYKHGVCNNSVRGACAACSRSLPSTFAHKTSAGLHRGMPPIHARIKL